MEFHEIRLLLDQTAVRALRGQNAAMVLAFLHRAFKRQLRVAVTEGELQATLENYLDDLRQGEPDAYPDSAADYLNRWCEDSHGFLRKYYGDSGEEPLFELTSGSEKALIWLESLRQTGFVGTESRLQNIFNGLEEILKFSNADAEDRVARLLEEMARIQAEIDRIRATGSVRTFSPVEIKERFALILAMARELVGDFRRVEDNFKAIAREIAERHAMPGMTKGAIVGHMLDSHDALRRSDQGQSFFAFWELLVAEDRRERFEQMLKSVLELNELDESLRRDTLLRQLVSHLVIEGEKVVGSHQRMSVNLRRVLDTASLQERRKAHDLIREIQTLALAVRDETPAEEGFFELTEFPEVFASMSRHLWQAAASADFGGPIGEADGTLGLDELRRFRNLPQIQLNRLRKNVEACLDQYPSVNLQQVLERFPPRHGMMEIIGYLIVASSERRHLLAEDPMLIELPPPSRQRWRVPMALFCRA